MANKTKKIDNNLKFKGNPRKITEKQQILLKQHLEELGDLSGVVYCVNNQAYVGGNQRSDIFHGCNIHYVKQYDEPTEQGTLSHGFIEYNGEEYAYREVSFTEEQFKQACIVANNDGGSFDWDILQSWDFEQLVEWGLESEFLGEGGFGKDDFEAKEDDYEVPEVVETDIVIGDLFEIGEHRLLCGDSTKKEDVEMLLLKNEPYLMVTDPPYGVVYDANWRNEADRANGKKIGDRAVGKVQNDDKADWSDAWILSPAKVAYVYHAGKFSGLVQKSLENCDFEIRSQIIWAKNNFAISRGDYHWKHEPCWYVVKKGFKANYIGDRSQTTLWEIPKPQKSETGHSTQKPIECMLKPIKNHDGDVYDPFLGSGSTMVAAHQLKRKCYGMELEPKYCQVIIDRMIKLQPNITVKKNGEPYKSAAK